MGCSSTETVEVRKLTDEKNINSKNFNIESDELKENQNLNKLLNNNENKINVQEQKK